MFHTDYEVKALDDYLQRDLEAAFGGDDEL